MDRNAQTQQEVDSAARQIKEKPYGKAILILAKELNKTPGSNINLLEIAAALEGIQEGEIQNPPQVTSHGACLLYTSPSPRDKRQARMPSSA